MPDYPSRITRRLLQAGWVAFSFFVLQAPLLAEDTAPISPQVKQCVDKAVGWLMSQQRGQGCFLDENRTDAVPQHSGAMTALGIMGICSVGHLPTDPTPEGKAVARALRFMTESIVPTDEGYLG